MTSSFGGALLVAASLLALVAPMDCHAAKTDIALSPDASTGIFLGLFLVAVLLFAIWMLMDISTSDRIGKPRVELKSQ